MKPHYSGKMKDRHPAISVKKPGKLLRGFSLLELSIVLVVIALITGMALMAGSDALESARRVATENKMDVIEKALMDFRVRYNRLPCPSSYVEDTGIEGLSANYSARGLICELDGALSFRDFTVEGGVPVRALGLTDEYMYDGWGRKFRYAMDMNAAVPDAFLSIKPNEACSVGVVDFPRNPDGSYPGTTFPGSSYSLSTDLSESIAVSLSFNSGGDVYVSSKLRSRVPVRDAQGAIYVLISHGANGHGALVKGSNTPISAGESTSYGEQTNCHCNSAAVDTGMNGVYVQADTFESSERDKNFDDIVRFKRRYQMQTESDIDNFGSYIGPQMATVDVNNDFALMSMNCGYWRNVLVSTTGSGIDPVSNHAGKTEMVIFSPKNDLLVYTTDGHCYEYLYGAADTVNPLQLGDGVNYEARYDDGIRDSILGNYETVCGVTGNDGSTRFALAYKAGIMVVVNSKINGDSQFIEMWQYSPVTHRYSFGRTLGSFISPALGNFNSTVAITPDGRYLYLAESRREGKIYRLSPDEKGILYKMLDVQPSFSGTPIDGVAAFSPDGKYFSVVTDSAVNIWAINSTTDSFTAIATPPDISRGILYDVNGITWSPDGNYLAITSNKDNASLLYENFAIFKVIYSPTTSELTFAPVLDRAAANVYGPATLSPNTYFDRYDGTWAPNNGNKPTVPHFTADSRYLVAGVPNALPQTGADNQPAGQWPLATLHIVGASGDYSVQPLLSGELTWLYGYYNGSKVPGSARTAIDVAH